MRDGRGPSGGTVPDLAIPVAPWQSRRSHQDHTEKRFSLYQLTAPLGSVALFSISQKYENRTIKSIWPFVGEAITLIPNFCFRELSSNLPSLV